jgi:hypothetical protein
MIFTKFSDPINGWTRKMEEEITVRKFAKAIGSAAAFGLALGIIVAQKSKKKQIKDIDNSTITIDMHDVKKLRIERIE